MRHISLSNNHVAIVDDEDYDRVAPYKWNASENAAGNVYAVSSDVPFKSSLMHRYILGVIDSSVDVDHRNRDGLDNRRENLRIATRSQNSANQRKHRGESKYKGVCWSKKGNAWQAQITVNLKHKRLGLFRTEIEAAAAYDTAAVHYFGEFARINGVTATPIRIPHRTYHNLEFRGERMNLTEWCKRLNLKLGTLYSRLKRGWSVDEALSTPTIPTGCKRKP